MASVPDHRRFAPAQRASLFLAADGRCVECGAELGDDWEADHRFASAAGGETDVVNGGAACAPCNAARGAVDAAGARTGALRAWQRRAMATYEKGLPRDFLVVGTPGSGKTRMAGTIAGRHLRSGRAERVIVVVPTERLKRQWADSVAPCGVQVAPDWANATGAMPSGFDGVVVTYAQLAALPDLFRRHCSARATVCVFDEIHHCGDSRRWGDALRHAFEPARWRMALSGTPFRSDNNAIPFVRYVDGVGQPDVTYDYGEAIAEGVCRPVFFPRRGGRMEWSAGTREIIEATFDDELPEDLANQRLRTALNLGGQWLGTVLGDAHRHLVEARTAVPDAGGLVLAADQGHARGIAEILRVRHGVQAVVVTSDEAGANERIEAFAAGDAPWLVAVRMVSEGVDIPRLRVGVYAAAVTTELFFRQAVGRLVRVIDADAGETASCFIPNDPRLRGFAAAICEQRDHVLDDEADQLLGARAAGSGPGRPTTGFQPIAAVATDAGGTFDGAELSAVELAYAAELKSRDRLTAALPTPAVAVLLRLVGEPSPEVAAGVAEEPAHRRRRALRAANHRTVGRIAYATGLSHAEVNRILNGAVGLVGVAAAGIEDLTQRLGLAQQWLTSGARPEPPSVSDE